MSRFPCDRSPALSGIVALSPSDPKASGVAALPVGLTFPSDESLDSPWKLDSQMRGLPASSLPASWPRHLHRCPSPSLYHSPHDCCANPMTKALKSARCPARAPSSHTHCAQGQHHKVHLPRLVLQGRPMRDKFLKPVILPRAQAQL
jgi:hypothetical protein